MLIDQKEQLVNDYHRWIENLRKKKDLIVKDNPMAFINFLDNEKVLKDERR
jgi:hypothetical protein